MRIEGVEASTVGLSLRVPVRSAGLVHSEKATLFIQVMTDEGTGWGECSAQPDARFPDPTLAGIEPTVVDLVVGRLFGACGRSGTLPPSDSIVALCSAGGSVAERSVAAALEMAVLDVELRSTGRSLVSRLGVGRRHVETGALVGMPEGRDLGLLLESVAAVLEGGARRVRLKIEPGWDHAPLQAVRTRFPDAVLQADANGSFDSNARRELADLDVYRLRCLEQPFDARDLVAHRELSDTMATPIALDESLWSPARVREVLAADACRVACLKPGRLGGIFATLEAAESCAEANVDCFVGGFFETGLGRAVNAALAGRAEFGLPGDLGDPGHYLVENPWSYLSTSGGLVELSDTPGLGAEVNTDVLRARTLGDRWLPFSS